jgi:hypothetical protein
MRSPIKNFYCSMSDHEIRTWTACRRIFSSDHFEEGFETGNVAYLQLSRSTPALRKVSVLVLVLVSQSNPLGLLHYRLISDVLSSGAMVSALLVDVKFISRILHFCDGGSLGSQTRAPSADCTWPCRLYKVIA